MQYDNIDGAVNVLGFISEKPFLCKSGLKIQICLFNLEFSTQINVDMLNLLMMLNFSCFRQKIHFVSKFALENQVYLHNLKVGTSNIGHNVLELYNFTMFQRQSYLKQVKWNLISSITNLVYQLPRDLPHNVRLRI